jgi:tetratricopeptide (TPR) repeat protein/CHAT domain-containing protein
MASGFPTLALSETSSSDEAEVEAISARINELYREGKYSEAIDLAEKVLERSEAIFGTDHLYTAVALGNLGVLYQAQGKSALAAPLLERALRIQETKLGSDDPKVATTVNNLASVYWTQGQYDAAIPLFQRTLRIREASSAPDDVSIAIPLNNLAQMYYAKGQYAAAEPLYQRALQILESGRGQDHPDVAITLANIAELHRAQGQYALAEPLYQRAIRINERALGVKHPGRLLPINNLALLYNAEGRYAEAVPLFQQALRLAESALGPEHPNLGIILNNMAAAYAFQAQFAAVEPLLERAIRIAEVSFGPNHPAVALSLHNLASLYSNEAKYDSAVPLYQRAIKIHEAALGADHPTVASSVQNLAELQANLGQTDEAISLYQRALRIREATLGVEHPDVATSLGLIGTLYRHQGKYDEAENFLKRALSIDEKALGQEHPDVARDLSSLAALYSWQGKHAAAMPLVKRAFSIRTAVFGPEHPLVAASLNDIALLYGTFQQPKASLTLFQWSLGIQTRLLYDVFSRSNEGDKYQYAFRDNEAYVATLSLIHQFLSHDPHARAIGLNLALTRKGIVLDSQARSQEVVVQSLNPELQGRWNQLQTLKGTLSNLILHPPSTVTPPAYRERLASLKKDITGLETMLASKSGVVADLLSSQRASLDEVAQRLPSDGVLIEIVKMQDWDWSRGYWTSTLRYVAFVLHGDGHTALVDLGDASELEPRVMEALAALRSEPWTQTVNEQLQAAKQLHTLLWQPLQSAIGTARTVLISPDAVLNLVPFSAFRSPDGHFLIEDVAIVTVSSGRDLLKQSGTLPFQAALWLVADPDYDWQPATVQPVKGDHASEDLAITRRVSPFVRLEGTAYEAAFIASLLPGEPKTLLVREQATEEAIFRANRPRVLHLATHGVFLPDSPEVSAKGLEIGGGTTPPSQNIYEAPLVRAGLALAGANYVEANTEARDGFLTALEISGMDLHATDLVVLSACETGAGEVRTFEGVYGLRRAVSLAGARNLVMSLWPVWDREASKQMQAFYRAYGNGESPAQALRTAQLERIAWMRTYLGQAPPSLWAPFTVQVSGVREILTTR